MELYIAVTLLAHALLAAGVGAHAEVTRRRPWRWAPRVLLTGVVGVVWYALRSSPRSPDDSAESAGPLGAVDSTTSTPTGDGTATDAADLPPDAPIPDEPPDWDRPRSKRLADPNSLHIDLPDGTTLTSRDQKAVTASIEYLDEHPDAGVDELCEEVFPEANAGYALPDVWWTETVRPALEALPEVEPPTDAHRRTLSFSVTELAHGGPETLVEVADGTRSATFRVGGDDVVPTSGRAIAETTPGWMRLARDAAVEWQDRTTGRSADRR